MNSVPKPKGSFWTEDQWLAISTRGDNVLISAAAGSGKTAVLVERIIRLISSEEEGIDVDRLLVATFTKAAASEMRHRIREALEKELSQKPHSGHLKKQLTLVHKANITTLHSFCLEVIQQNFQSIQMDPKFRIGNDTETELIRQEVLEELFERHYENSPPDSEFWKLVEAYTGERNDDLLFHLVLRLYHYSRSHPWPDRWLQQMADTFQTVSKHHKDDDVEHGQLWLQSLIQSVQIELNGILELLKEAIKLANEPNGPFVYVDNILEDIQLVEQLLSAANEKDWKRLYLSFQNIQFLKLKSTRNQEIDPKLQDQVKELRNEAKKLIGGIREELFERSPETFYQELKEIAPLMQVLVNLIQEFSEQYQLAKADKGLVDYGDLEHFCLQILCDVDHDLYGFQPSQIALNYQSYFEEVLIDEYQDTNMVQEAILSLISKAKPGNRFMVGDVKQSIYRFRLAEPGLFLDKYNKYENVDTAVQYQNGIKIDLSKNFRSRKEVINGVNYIFKQLMNKSVGEMAYDEKAALIYGDGFSKIEQLGDANSSIHIQLIDRSSEVNHQQDIDHESDLSISIDSQDLETAQLEALNIIKQIKKIVGENGEPFYVIDKQLGNARPVTYKDIVILLRSTQQWSPIFTEEFKKANIPCYADLDSGYFEAGEVEVMLSVLKVIDNPYQDIALAAVLRSPIVQLSADEMALIRLADPNQSYFEALQVFINQEENNEHKLKKKLDQFSIQLESWRIKARQGSLSDLIWHIYRETLFYDMVGGMPGGIQKQANLRLLYDRAKQYEKTSFRGLFRFLTFINQMRDRGGDLGTARTIGEQENVVRLMSIHKSKGLEFPVVFVAGINKMFNFQDLHNPFLMHKQLGFGPKYMDITNRISYPTLPSLAIKRRLQLEMLAEEMRILYVALTRAKEKLFLVGTVKDLKKKLLKWRPIIENTSPQLPDYVLVKARCYFDWLGPALIRHDNAKPMRDLLDHHLAPRFKENSYDSEWEFEIVPAHELVEEQKEDELMTETRNLASLTHLQKFEHKTDSGIFDLLSYKFNWKDQNKLSQTLLSKTSVSEMKRITEIKTEMISKNDEETINSLLKPFPQKNNLKRRPRFMEQKQVNAAERGTVYHAIMQHIPIHEPISLKVIQQTIDHLLMKNMISIEQSEQVDISVIHTFFQSELGTRLNLSKRFYREVPFSYGLPAKDVYGSRETGTSSEIVLVQGIIDCLFLENDHFILIDYKTDAIYGNKLNEIKERYKMQIEMYSKAVEHIWKIPVLEHYLYLFDGAHTVKIN
ncbi:helicase-exonuclease AddAB subunit AddA [Chengkuizengella sediminis]|uniref:helicase-exonuclease AddAB subunit AddA n=1 Tax=Chengkuizengella sediminis TaxID=1885917 RepID=UPI0013895D9B|nr:helicase-exonuclease AddAB subunit AddA [Chengkuizengella sediminis]